MTNKTKVCGTNDSVLTIYEEKWRHLGKQNIAGVDEAGRGPLAGPVVAASVIFEAGVIIEGVNDSKKISRKKREQLFDIIIKNCKCYSIAVINNEKIDEINILRAALLAMKTSVDNLETRPDVVLIDGNFAFETDIESETIIKGDAKSFSIAAASILAKVQRDRIMEQYDKEFPQYGFAKHMGYATKAHYEAISRYGICDIHRKSFKLKF